MRSERNINEDFARVWVTFNGQVFTSYQEVVTVKCPLDVTDFPFGLCALNASPARSCRTCRCANVLSDIPLVVKFEDGGG